MTAYVNASRRCRTVRLGLVAAIALIGVALSASDAGPVRKQIKPSGPVADSLMQRTLNEFVEVRANETKGESLVLIRSSDADAVTASFTAPALFYPRENDDTAGANRLHAVVFAETPPGINEGGGTGRGRGGVMNSQVRYLVLIIKRPNVGPVQYRVVPEEEAALYHNDLACFPLEKKYKNGVTGFRFGNCDAVRRLAFSQ